MTTVAVACETDVLELKTFVKSYIIVISFDTIF